MSTDGRSAADWVGSFRTSAAAWWLPQLVIVAALLLPPAARGVIWVIALAWMGTACLSLTPSGIALQWTTRGSGHAVNRICSLNYISPFTAFIASMVSAIGIIASKGKALS